MTIGNVNIVDQVITGRISVIVEDKLHWRNLNAIKKVFYYYTPFSSRSRLL